MLTACALSVAIVTFLAHPSQQPDSLPADLERAYQAIRAGSVDDAISSAERYSRNHPRDPRGFLVLGDAYAARLPGGRFRALQAYREAKRLAPVDPEPSYRLARLALQLGGDDGERIAREELERILGLDPLYKDAWAHWLTLYRNSGGRRRIIDRLHARRQHPIVLARIAQLLIEEESYGDANALLNSVLEHDSTNVVWNALRAQSAFEHGDTLAGISYYEVALRHVTHDSTDAMWRQVIGIASPNEIRAWRAGVPPQEKGAWLQSFWAQRDPNLFAGRNHRIAEHFARLRYARKHYPLLHPLVTYHRNARGRALNLEPSQGEREHHLRCEVFQGLPPAEGGRIPLPGVSRAVDRLGRSPSVLEHLTTEEKRALPDAVRGAYEAAEPGSTLPTVFAPLGLDLRDIDTTAARIGYNLATGLDDRGLLYLRFGPPARVKLGGDNPTDPQCNTTELERWRYAELGEIRFAKPSAFSKGLRTSPEMLFRPMNREQFDAMSLGLRRDASAEPALLDFGVWTAQFRGGGDSSMTDVVVVSTAGELAATLVGTMGGRFDVVRNQEGFGTVSRAPGRYVLLAHARTGATIGRQDLRIALRSFATVPAMSDMLLAKAWPAEAVHRQEMIAHVQRDLIFSRGETVRVYAELYGLDRQASEVNYRATYRLLRSNDLMRDIIRENWEGSVSFEFDRRRRAAIGSVEHELLDISPDFVPTGKYLLRLEIRDNTEGARVGRATVAFEVR